MLNLLFLIWSLQSFGMEIPCPPDAMAVEHRSPVTYQKKITCGYMKDGTLVKHGDEVTLDDKDKIIKTVSFNHGKEGERPAVIIKKEPPKNLPGAEEASATFKVLQDLMKVLAFGKEGLNQGKFRVHHCDPKPSTWVRAALTKTEIKKTYAFKENCDVAGSFTASFLKEFPVSFDLRNLEQFNKTDMKVKMEIKQASRAIRYRFEVREGKLSSPNKKIEFKVDYEVDVDPVTGSTIFDSQEGTITLTKIDNDVVSLTRPLIFTR